MSSEPSESRVIAGRYRLVRALGAGAHGVVELACDVLHGDRFVAVKRLEGLLGAGDPEPASERLRWFLHPNWAEVLDEGRLPDHGRFQVTRYVPGRSLDKSTGPAAADEVWKFLEDAARVLGALHGNGLIHYDVTPGNWLREERADGSLSFVLTDGGLANVGAVRGIARGTPRFMAPEVTEGKPHDHRADLYSLGLVAFLMATGRDPFEGGAGEVLGRRRREDSPGVRSIRADLPEGLERVIAQLLERDPERRIESGAALLRRIGEARGIDVPAVGEDEAVALATGGPLVGRAAEMSRFRRSCRAIAESGTATGGTAATGEPFEPVLVVHGPPGSGGTRLLREFAAVARGDDVAVLTLSGREGAADRRSPLRRLADSLADLAGGIDSGFSPSRLEGRAGRDADANTRGEIDARVIERFVDVCERSAARIPVALLVEDFADLTPMVQEALRVLSRHLLSRTEHPDGRARPRLVLAVDHGAEDPTPFLIPDSAEPRRPCLLLGPLDATGVRTLLSSRLPGFEPPATDLAALQAASEGLPRFLVGLVSEGLRRGEARREGLGWIWVTDHVPTYPIDRALPPQTARALETLSVPARRLLTQLVLLDVSAPQRLVAALADAPTIAALVATPLLALSHEGPRERYAPASNAVKDAIRRASDATHPAARDALLAALATIPAPELAAEDARLRLDAGDAPGAIALIRGAIGTLSPSTRLRAQATLLRAFQSDVRLLNDPAARSLATHLLSSSSPNPVFADLLQTALEGKTDSVDLESAHRLSEYFLAVRAYPRCVALAAAVRGGTQSHGWHGSLMFTCCRALLAQGKLPEAASCVREATAIYRRARSHATPDAMSLRALRLSTLARYRFMRGQYAQAVAAASRARKAARAISSPLLASQAYTTMAVALQQLGRTGEAERATERSIRIKMAVGDVRGAAGNLHNLARMKQQRGTLLEAAAILNRVVGIGSRYADAELGSLALLSLAELFDQQSNVQLALDAIRRARDICAAGNLPSRAIYTTRALASLSALAGMRAEARRSLLVSARDARRSRDNDAIAQHFATSALVATHEGRSERALGLLRHIPAGARLVAVSDSITSLRLLARLGHDRRVVKNLSVHAPPSREVRAYRVLIAGVLHAQRNPNAASRLSAFRRDLTPAGLGVSGPQFRMLAEVFLRVLCVSQALRSQARPALAQLAQYAERNSLPTLRRRVSAVSFLSADEAGDTSAAYSALSLTLAIADPATATDSSLADEARLALAALDRRFSPSKADRAAPPQIRLHAHAHRLVLDLRAGQQPDTRLQTALRTILNVAARLQTGSGLEALLESLNTYAREITGAERTCVVLLGPDSERTVQITSAPSGDPPQAKVAPVSHALIQRVIATRTPVLLHDVFGDSELMERPSITSMALRSVLCVPMLRGRDLFGVMYADSSVGAGSFDKVDLEILSLFAEQAAAAIETSRLLADVQKSYSELKATQERLIRGERLRVMGEMTSGVAHDFNNLLTAILARIQLLNLGYLTPDVREHLGLIEKAALDAAEVVRRLQGFSRARREAGFTRLDMSDLCADVVELLRPLWSSRRRHGKPAVAVRLRASKGLAVSGDPTELREILTNLLKNSLDALELGGAITVSADVRDGRVRVEVSDDGPGISKELQAKLFQPFFTTKGERGTGLGLCLSLQIAERHGGDLRLRSEEGQGTTATLELPQAIGPHVPITSSPSPVPSRSEPGTSVLVIDDDPDVRTPLCAYLQRSGFLVSSAGSAADGLERVREHQPDLIISDIVMPGIDGIELCRRVKATLPKIPVVLMSGQASAIDANLVKDAGATALLAKPFTMRQVLDLASDLTRKT